MLNIIQFAALLVLPFYHLPLTWVYPEHREIAARAMEMLSADYQSVLNQLWQEARLGYENKLTETAVYRQADAQRIDYAAWSAIAGDHSCSAEDMLDIILHSDWILDVARINAELKTGLANAEDRAELINALRSSDIRLQKADADYATRAGGNNAHFLLSLDNVNMTLDDYIRSCLEYRVEINSLAIYYIYHSSALKKAAAYKSQNLAAEERSALILSALADEAFAQHFLEDMFAAGHSAGTWGDVSQRKGTHDYYNEHGLKAVTWRAKKMVLMGDAWMRNEDAQLAASVISTSLMQVLDASQGKFEFIAELEADTVSLDVCSATELAAIQMNAGLIDLLKQVLIDTPVPELTKGLGELPRFRAELGPFFGISPSLRGSILYGGFAESARSKGVNGGIGADFRFGLGLDGVLNESGDGLVFLSYGWRQDSGTSSGFVDDAGVQELGTIGSAIPGRSAYSLRFRLPFYVLPLDLLVAAPVLLIVDPDASEKMAVTAVNGGLIPWQSAIATSLGRVQFVLGREIGISFFGRGEQKDALFAVSEAESKLTILTYQSTQIELPILEFGRFRSFSEDQSSSTMIQIYAGVDIPYNVKTAGNAPDYHIRFKNVWFLGARFVFDWRHYF